MTPMSSLLSKQAPRCLQGKTFRFQSLPLLTLALLLLVSASGCQSGTSLVHQRSMAELNQKAQMLMQAGDTAGAVARLESAHDLEPNEPNTAYNLAMAYQSLGRFDQAIGVFTQILDKPVPGGPEPAEVRKAMGITWEAKADKLAAEAKNIDDEKNKLDPAKSQILEQEATQAYKAAIDNYRQAVDSGHLKDATEVKRQMAALQERLAKGLDSSKS
jgi:tetratricopeptide (TPR) repeat protein